MILFAGIVVNFLILWRQLRAVFCRSIGEKDYKLPSFQVLLVQTVLTILCTSTTWKEGNSYSFFPIPRQKNALSCLKSIKKLTIIPANNVI